MVVATDILREDTPLKYLLSRACTPACREKAGPDATPDGDVRYDVLRWLREGTILCGRRVIRETATPRSLGWCGGAVVRPGPVAKEILFLPPGPDAGLPPIRIRIVTLTGKKSWLWVWPGKPLILMMIDYRELEGVPLDHMRFIAGGRRLNDPHVTPASLGWTDGMVVHLRLCLSGC